MRVEDTIAITEAMYDGLGLRHYTFADCSHGPATRTAMPKGYVIFTELTETALLR